LIYLQLHVCLVNKDQTKASTQLEAFFSLVFAAELVPTKLFDTNEADTNEAVRCKRSWYQRSC